MYLKDEISKILYFLRKEEEKCSIELLSSPKGHLILSCQNGRIGFSQAIKEEEKYHRIGITKNEELQRALCRKEFIEIKLNLLHENIRAIEKIERIVKDISTEEIFSRISKAYKYLPEEYFFNKSGDSWQTRPYKQSTYKAEQKTHTTSRGLKVRSKSELLIAEKFYEFDIPFRYEQMIRYEKWEFAPDFIINRDEIRMRQGLLTNEDEGTDLYYWEHCGLTSNSQYMSHHKWKMEIYEKMGIVPWNNLIVTYDDENGNLNIPLIESEIINKVLRL